MAGDAKAPSAWPAAVAVAIALAIAAVALSADRPKTDPNPRPATGPRTAAYGHSVRGRPLQAVAIGDPRAPRRVLVVGCIHGNECAGKAVTRRLATLQPPPGTQLWLVDDANPDGTAARTRQNAHGVDLNRNFGHRWRRLDRRGGLHWSGPRPLSEPESRAARALILRIRPHVTIWYHQRLKLVDDAGGDVVVAARYARLVGLRLRSLESYPGSATTWQNHALRPATAFVVELPGGRLSQTAAARHAAAVHSLARPEPAAPAPTAVRNVPRPAIVQRRIPFGARRRTETAAYSRRHYGRPTWRLTAPRVIVEHYSVTATASAVFNEFATDRRDSELHELPGTCAHFVIDRDGRTLQLVDLGTICRHALGLNYTAIGIEHVGFSDAEVMGSRRQLAASLRLTHWLRCRHGIALRDVIGHAETLSSPHFAERFERLRDGTHGDLARPAMSRYRARLARMRCG